MTRTSEADLKRLIQNRDRVRDSADQHIGHSKTGRTPRAKLPATNLAPSPSKYRSKLEETFAYRLVLEKRTGIILDYWYEPANLRLPGEKNFYKPDFLVLTAGGLTFYEVKGRNMSDDASLVKIKTAAGLTPWAKFVLVKRINGQWDERMIA